ncbi:hypothetical protein DFH07DRAFT_764108 [Mycena maculata]|uniref:Uncharacterized protein n=1 Tax=Mycena maculata TaxID=230809 RepID=A0AAD7KDY6_9AGAR|nr:hypothetical protein DFH07DRAFT_764108 [Mycena maculata]
MALIFGSCCGHKDMQAFRANSTTIRLGEHESAAVQAAEEASTCGIIKAMALLGALFHHKDEDKGYQDKYCLFMQQKVSGICGSFGRAAAVVTEYYAFFIQLIELIWNGKTKAGANHVEKLVLLALNCVRTMAEVVAAALYSLCISWLYMQIVRSKDVNGVLPNLLDLVDIHRKLPDFCRSLAANPSLFFAPNAVDFPEPQALASQLLDLPRMISAMFSGTGVTWIRFTPEFVIVHIRYHPNSTPESFSALERYHHNNTESFAAKYITAKDLLYIMREKRKREELLRATGLEQDLEKIQKMTVAQLKEQYNVYKLIIKDAIILKTTLVSIPRHQDKLDIVVAALKRYQE